MPVYQVFPISERVTELVRCLATSLDSQTGGETRKCATDELEIFRYSLSTEYWDFTREYLRNVANTIRHPANDMELRAPPQRPLFFHYIQGWLSTQSDDVGVILPILHKGSTEGNIRIWSATENLSYTLPLEPCKMIVLSTEVRFQVSAHIPLVLILHPISPEQQRPVGSDEDP
ncbi:hypothetical protein P154DRAFT_527056 [Amniculicola lignicola CBS 123094]|uniref:Uncharacterized protein n=1 Tax=Amniculicola lignicola CBS 123094 TaxID=1392246 RepID=A0A6A5VZQ6_9PLEO|nr:hypothetical protein P154DRAFT_527056 [Amniculicola lignicola CBS 123094]